MPTTEPITRLIRQGPTCPECGRRFDLLDEDDAAEWAYGHECEGEYWVATVEVVYPTGETS